LLFPQTSWILNKNLTKAFPYFTKSSIIEAENNIFIHLIQLTTLLVSGLKISSQGESQMDLEFNIVINVFSIILLFIIYLHSIQTAERKSLQFRLFFYMLFFTALMLVIDVFSRCDGLSQDYYPLFNRVGNFLIFAGSPIIPFGWLLYAYLQVFKDEKKVKKFYLPLFLVFLAHLAMVIASQYTGWFYYIDAANVYHRGPLYFLSVGVTLVTVVAVLIFIALNRKIIAKKYFFSLMFFPFPPVFCIIFQIVFEGYSLILNGIVLSLFIVFLDIQNRSMKTDYLTGVYNRQALDNYLKVKISSSGSSGGFSAIWLDLDQFKIINDTFGHDIGDRALVKFAALLKGCINASDFISRYGGDEFCIVLNTQDQKALEATVGCINAVVKEFNESNSAEYKIEFSMGYDIYDRNLYPSPEKFLKHLDDLMYVKKREMKKIGNDEKN